MIFYIKKRCLISLTHNQLFIKAVLLFLSHFIENCNILYTKMLFPIEETRGKLLIEIVYEIFLEIYLESLRNPEIQTLQAFFNIFQELFNENRIKKNLIGKHYTKEKSSNHEKIVYTPFYVMDRIPYIETNNISNEKYKIDEDIYISKEFYDLKDYIILHKYKDEIKEEMFSSCILFCIKIIITINDIEDYYKNNNNNLSQSLLPNSSSINDDETISSR